MEEVERLARVAVTRGVGIAAAAIALTMFEVSFVDLRLSAYVGGFAFLVLGGGLLLRAWTSHRIDPRHTEVWHLIDPTPRMREACREHVADAMRRAALSWAEITVAIASILLGLSLAARTLA